MSISIRVTPPPPQTITFEYFDYHGVQIYGMVITEMLCRAFSNDETLQPHSSYLVTEKDFADALECSLTRLHKSVVRSKMFRDKPIRVESLDEYWFGMAFDRLEYQRVIYNPISIYNRVIEDLAKRRPYVNKARELYIKVGCPEGQFGRQGLIK